MDNLPIIIVNYEDFKKYESDSKIDSRFLVIAYELLLNEKSPHGTIRVISKYDLLSKTSEIQNDFVVLENLTFIPKKQSKIKRLKSFLLDKKIKTILSLFCYL